MADQHTKQVHLSHHFDVSRSPPQRTLVAESGDVSLYRLPVVYYCIDSSAEAAYKDALINGTRMWATAFTEVSGGSGSSSSSMIVEVCPSGFDAFSNAPPILSAAHVRGIIGRSPADKEIYVPVGHGFVEWFHRNERAYSLGSVIPCMCPPS